MLRINPVLLTAALVLLCSFAIAKDPKEKGKDKPLASDIERLQGSWIADLEPDLRGEITFDGGDLRYVHFRGERETLIWDGHFAINDHAKPKHMDWTPLRQQSRSVMTNLAIYELQGDLLLVIGNTEGERPTAFYSGGGTQRPKTVIFHRATATRNRKPASQRKPNREPVADVSSNDDSDDSAAAARL